VSPGITTADTDAIDETGDASAVNKSVGFVGLGAMGAPMSRHLLDAGWTVYGFDVSDQARERFRANGGVVLDTAEQLVGRTDIVVLSLPTSRAVFEVLKGLGRSVGGGPRLSVVETSTLSLADKEHALELATVSGLDLFDCPVSGTSAQAERRDLVAYLSGPEVPGHSRVRQMLVDMTRETFDVGSFGSGTKMKLVANLLVAVHNVAAAEALVLAARAGLDPDLVLRAVGSGAGTSKMFEVRGPLMVRGTYAEEVTARVDVFAKDLRAISDLARSLTTPTPLLSATEVFYQAALAQGRGDQDTACVHGVLQSLVGQGSCA
jgi:putative dehydrogenase